MSSFPLTSEGHLERKHVAIGTQQRTCQDHGDYTATCWELQPKSVHAPAFWGNCPTCDADWQREADVRDAEIRGGTTERDRIRAMRRIEAGIPERFKDSTVWNWQHGMDQQRHVWEWAREYCNAFDISLQSGRSGVLTGAPGTGKTHLAIGVLYHVLEKGCAGLYTTVMSLLGRIKDTYNRQATETEAKVIAHVTGVDLLVIDEVGRSLDSNYEQAQFFRVLDLRYQHCKPTILVSNMSKAKLIEFLGEAVVDRLREAGGALLVFDWASQRSARKQGADEP